jgi:hypothetical protein
MKLSENQILIMSTIMTEKNIAYKAFDKNMQCRGFQFEVGAHYEHNGKVEPCKSGFHACKNPLDVWNYYQINSRYAIVEIAGDVVDSGSDSKVVCSNISIVQEIALTELIDHSVKYMLNECYDKLAGHNSNLAASGDGSKLAASGYNSNLAASGDYSKLAASGKNSICMAAGYASTAQVGENGVIVLPYYDGIRTRVAVGYVGENGIEPNVEYKVNNNGIFEKVNM